MDTRKGNRDQFLHRRRMAYVALAGGMLFPLLVLFTENPQVTALSMQFYAFVMMIIGGYYATSTIEHNNVRKTDAATEVAKIEGEH